MSSTSARVFGLWTVRRVSSGRHRALLGDGGRDLILALIEAAEVFEAVSEVTQDLVIHRACGFLTVAGDKRDRIALVDQFNRALHVFDV